MAQKEPVENQPTCLEEEIVRIDPVWVYRRVPKGFWFELENRRNYLLWLGHKLRFGRLHDWYRLTYEDMARRHGSGVAGVYWRSSPVCAVMECFPNYDWQEWFFIQVPRAFWQNQSNRRRYLRWLGKQIGIRHWQDWYRATTQDFQDHRGGSLLLEYHSSVSATVMACYPERDWHAWEFARMPMRLWDNRATCRQYMNWLGKRLGYTCLDDWYGLKLSDVEENHGAMLAHKYRDSVSALVIDLVPRRRWCEWKFGRVPTGFWDCPENRRRYVRWLGKRLGYRRRKDWHRLRRRHFQNHYGGSLAGMYRSAADLLEECFPDWDWTSYRRQRCRARKGAPRPV